MAIKSEKNQKMMVVMISILLAFFLWLYVMGEKNPVQTKVLTDVPVTLTNTDTIAKNNLSLVPDQAFLVDLNVTGRAFDISKLTTADIKVEANMDVNLKNGNNSIPIKINYAQRGISITNRKGSLFINVKLDDFSEKTVPVIVNVKGSVKDGFGYTRPIVRPSEVKISGPEEYVTKVLSVTGEITINGNYSNISGSIAVDPRDKDGTIIQNVNINPQYVDATVSIKPSKEVPIKINTYGDVGNGKVLKDIKSKISNIIIVGDKKYLDNISEINTTAFDLSKVTDSTTIHLALNLPMGVSTADGINSINVDLTVENKVEKVLDLPVNINSKSADYNYNLPYQNVNVRLAGPESIINAINDRNISAFVNVSGFTEGNYSLPVTISQIDGVEVVTLTPDKIDVEILKK